MAGRDSTRAPWARVRLMGVEFDSCTRSQAVDFVSDQLSLRRGGCILTANLHHMRTLSRDGEARAYAAGADLVVPDGMPLLWAGRLQRTPFPERVAGSDMIWDLSAGMARSGRSVLVLGGAPGVAARAADVLRRRHSGLRIAGSHSPPWGFTGSADEVTQIGRVIAECDPDLVLVGLPFPVQERLIDALVCDFPAVWFAGLGASLSFVSGDVPRAPRWMQTVGLEWVHRLMLDPRRMARRYLVEGLPFLPRLVASALRHRGSPKLTSAPGR